MYIVFPSFFRMIDLAYSLVLPYVGGQGLMNLAATCKEAYRYMHREHKWEKLNVVIKDQEDFAGLAQFMRTADVSNLRGLRLTIYDTVLDYRCGLGPKSVPSLAELSLIFTCTDDARTRAPAFDVTGLLADCFVLFPSVTSFYLHTDTTGFCRLPEMYRELLFVGPRSIPSPWRLNHLSLSMPAVSQTQEFVDCMLDNTDRLLVIEFSGGTWNGPATKRSEQDVQVDTSKYFVVAVVGCRSWFS